MSATRISKPLTASRADSSFSLVLETARTRAPRVRAAFATASPIPSEPPIITTCCSVIMCSLLHFCRKHTLHTQFLRRDALGRTDGCDQRKIGEALVPFSKHHG